MISQGLHPQWLAQAHEVFLEELRDGTYHRSFTPSLQIPNPAERLLIAMDALEAFQTSVEAVQLLYNANSASLIDNSSQGNMNTDGRVSESRDPSKVLGTPGDMAELLMESLLGSPEDMAELLLAELLSDAVETVSGDV